MAGLVGPSIASGSAQYRARYAEPESDLAARCQDAFDVVLVVPLCGESPTFVNGLQAAARRAGRLLLIAVINGRVGADDSVHAQNAACMRALRARFSLQDLGCGGWLGQDASMRMLVVDRFTTERRLPSRQGVGLARKIGADVALALIAAGRVRHPFIAMTDADTSVPEDYFTRIAALEPDCAAALFPFWHEPSGTAAVDRATALYEIRLRYIQRGLQWASSPYAFHTVGSTMAVHALRYAQVRGVPRRRAAEDFYLLGKLCKLRPLARLQGLPVLIRSRVSDRVPFGTGAETTRLSRGDAGARLELVHPDCFGAVRDVTRHLLRLSERPARSGSDLLTPLSAPVQDFLESQGARRVWPQLSEQAPTPPARLRWLHDWFDGFRTLKLIHHVRDHGASSLPWQDAIRRAPFMNDVDGDVDDDGGCLVHARTELLRLEQTLPRLVGPGVQRREASGFARGD